MNVNSCIELRANSLKSGLLVSNKASSNYNNTTCEKRKGHPSKEIPPPAKKNRTINVNGGNEGNEELVYEIINEDASSGVFASPNASTVSTTTTTTTDGNAAKKPTNIFSPILIKESKNPDVVNLLDANDKEDSIIVLNNRKIEQSSSSVSTSSQPSSSVKYAVNYTITHGGSYFY